MSSIPKNKWYVTTPIYYVTARPHLGSLYSTVLADVSARWNKIKGKKVFFLTGTDEHGQKIAQAAEQAGKKPKEFVDSFIDAYKKAWSDYEIEYTKFIRTTDDYHVKAVQDWLSQLLAQGDIYKAFYKGWYCTSCETFVTEHEAHEQEMPPCPSCGRATHWVSEETYFFRLSAYQERLLKFYEENPDFIVPKERFAEVISFVKSGLKDLSISRTTITWGIPFPGDNKHVTYVWADALNNYITGVGYDQPGKEQEFNFWWPADVHIMGKDIVRFHAVYWPAFLMASGLALPKHLLVHGWIKVGAQKMSKSLGNVIDPIALKEAYGADPVRYYLLRALAITHDSEFSIADLEQKIESDLANDLGNLLNRLVTLAHKYDFYDVAPKAVWSVAAIELRDQCLNAVQEYELSMDEFQFHMALAKLWKFINQVNAYFHSQEPWKLVKNNRAEFEQVISAAAHGLYTVGLLLWPVMPEKMEQLLKSLGKTIAHETNIVDLLKLGIWKERFMLHKIDALFAKPMSERETAAPEKIEQPKIEEPTYIGIEDFAKVQLKVGTIKECTFVDQSDKLLKLQVDFGADGMRQVLSGIRKYYQPEQLIGKQALFVVNLKPRKILGLESQGMMLFAKDEAGNLKLMMPEQPVISGSQLS
ncbi:MAG: methionine--tRNA ligase [Candidatus Dependentiae bacterium]